MIMNIDGEVEGARWMDGWMDGYIYILCLMKVLGVFSLFLSSFSSCLTRHK